MVSLSHLTFFAIIGIVSCFQFCSFFTENGWFSVDPVNSICFKYYNNFSTWWDAKRSCEQEGLFLARPDRESISAFLQRKTNDWNEDSFWIGGINQEESGWKWTNGDEMGFNNFDSFLGTLNRIFGFFKKSTSCAMCGYVTWLMKSCDELAPYLCQSGRNTAPTTVEPDSWLNRTRFSDSSTKFCEPVSRQGSLRLGSPGTLCFVYFEERSSWWDANKSCHEQNMSLVMVSDWRIDDKLQQIRGIQIIGFWIGAINKDNTGWKWENGEDMVYTNFDSLGITWDRIFKQTLCGVRESFGWKKQGCDKLYPFMCQFYQNSTMTTPKNAASKHVMKKECSHPVCGTSKAEATSVEQEKQRTFKVKKSVGGRLNPKLIHPGQKKPSAIDLFSCCRLCSSEDGCELVNFCEISASCELYGNFDSAVSGGTTSEAGCSIYVDMEKVN